MEEQVLEMKCAFGVLLPKAAAHVILQIILNIKHYKRLSVRTPVVFSPT